MPFLSKVTGVPMVELAVRIGLGATLADLGWERGLRPSPPFVAVKAPAFSTAKLKGVDPSVGPFMQSTGEVIGIAVDPRVAMAKALTGASLVPPRRGDGEAPFALLSIADRDKWGLIPLAKALRRAGYRLAATPGTRAALAEAGIRRGADREARRGAGVEIGERPILEAIAGGDVRLVVNTPDAALGRRARRGRHPPRGDRRGRAVPHGDRDGDRGGRGARSRDRGRRSRTSADHRVGAVERAGGRDRVMATVQER